MTYRVLTTWTLMRNPSVFAGFGTVMAVAGGASSGSDQMWLLGLSVVSWLGAISVLSPEVYEIRLIGVAVEFRRLRGSTKVPVEKITAMERRFLLG